MIESQFENDNQRSEFNLWLKEVYIISYGRVNRHKFIEVRTFNKNMNRRTLYLHKKHFKQWLDERIQEYKQLNLLK